MRSIVFLLPVCAALAVFAAEKNKVIENGAATDKTLLTLKHTNIATLIEGANDQNITRVVAKILERSHYNRQTLGDEVASKFLDRYLDALDNLHLYFLQSDLQDFEKYRTKLDDLAKEGNTDPARVIFNRFRERLHQQYDHVAYMLGNEKFTFTSDDKFLANRKNAPRPKDLNEAKQLWRDRLRYEYLQEKLSLRPEVIGNIVQEKLKQKNTKELLPAIQDKLSKEKAEEVVKMVETRLEAKDSRDTIVKAVVEKLEKDNAEEITKVIIRRYQRVLRALDEYDNDDVLQVYLTSLSHVYDPHSDYMGKSELENFSIGMKLSLGGIGALLRSEDGYCKIQSLVAGGPADRSKKLKANDKIIAVGQSNSPPVDVVDMKLNKVVEMIRGPKGTEVRLTVIPADAPDPSARKTVNLIRDDVKLEDQEAKAKIVELPDENNKTIRLGLIDLPSFYSGFELEGRKNEGDQKSTTSDVSKLLRKLMKEKVSGVILDLRRNGGGSLEEAINLTGLFIKEGPVVQIRDSEGRVFVENDPDPGVIYEGPLIVLTSRFSASASEILAGALQDYGRALIVGDSSTHGKGTVQSLIQLGPILRTQLGLVTTSNPGAIKVTIRKFYRASGSSTQLKGVVPDIVLPSIYNEADVGEKSLENPLPWDTIPTAKYEKLNRVEPYVAEIKKRSDSRISKDKDFSYLKEEIERYKKQIAEKTVSLNEEQRLKEKKENDERIKARKKELAARPELPGKVYEITLKNAEEAGLPAPVTKTNSVKTAEGKTNTNTSPQDATHVAASAADEDAEESTPEVSPVDIALEEVKKMLIDYAHLAPGRATLAGPTPNTRPPVANTD